MGSFVDNAAVYFFEQLDPDKTGRILAVDAATFLRSSGIATSDLALIWDLSDRNKVGALDLLGLSTAIKLVALVQNGIQPTAENLKMNVPAAKFSGYPSFPSSGPGTPDRVGTPPSRPSRPTLPDKSGESWVVSPQSRAQYESIFHSLNPTNGKLSGGKVKPILQKSGLHVGLLGQIWELSDVDRDGHLDMEEFSLAMFLLNKARQGEKTPTSLPANYIPPCHRVVYTKVQKVNWLVPAPIRRAAADEFTVADSRGLGVLTGADLRPLLVSKGVPMLGLAKIWALCDITSTGKLNQEQYALALHLIDLHKKGTLPEVLPIELVPPTLRAGGAGAGAPATSAAAAAPAPAAVGGAGVMGSPHLPPRGTATLPAKQPPPRFIHDKTATLAQSYTRSVPIAASTPNVPTPATKNTSTVLLAGTGSPFSASSASVPSTASSIPDELASLNLGSGLDNADFSVIKELDTYTKESDSLTKEKKDLQTEIKSAEEGLSMAGVELKDMKKQLSSLEEEVEQARKQRDEVQARLDEADAERRKYEELISELHKKALHERHQIEGLQQQIASQDALRKSQEEELQKARDELQKLRQEESHYLHLVESGKRQLDTLIANLKIVQSDTNVTQSKLVQIEAAHRTIDKALAELAPFGRRYAGSEGKPSILTNIHEVTQLRRQEQDVTQMSDITRATAGSSPVSSMSGFSVDSYMETHYETKTEQPVQNSNPFGPPSSDPFQADVDPFGGTDPFKTKPSVGSSKESESSGVNEEPQVQSGTNTPQMNRRKKQSSESATLKTEEENDSTFPAGGTSNPFESGADPFKPSEFEQNPFEGNPFQEGSADIFGAAPNEDPFGSKMDPSEDPFATPSTGDPFGNSGNQDPFGAHTFDDVDDPFKEKNLFASEVDAFNTNDPFANTPDPFAGSTDLFKGSNTSLASRGTRGSKNSLNNFKNFGSKNSLQGSKTSLNESNTADSSPKLQVKSADEGTPEEDPSTEVTKAPPTDGAFNDLSSKSDDQFETPDDTPDPFPAVGKDPFSTPNSDPFTNSNTAADPFKSSGFGSDPFASTNGPENDPFSSANADPFGNSSDDPFRSGGDANDPFGTSSTNQFTAKFDDNDPFASSTAADPFSVNQKTGDPFDPFAGNGTVDPPDSQSGFTATFS